MKSHLSEPAAWSKHFDLDLKFGQEGEQWLKLLGNEQKIEVKRERDTWAKTGNIFFELLHKGNPSGIAATTSQFWAHILSLNGVPQGVLIFSVPILKHNLRRLARCGSIRQIDGGDGGGSTGYLVPLALSHELLKPMEVSK